jgi:lipopolysaccharide transport system ATP-binding protein
MSDTVIRVENLSKRYRIGLREKQAKTISQAAKGIVSSPFKYLNSMLREPAPEEVFWALQNVSFEVKRGDVVGIIGRNGAGKSTLLKILSQITEPTSGFAEIRGRVRSLLEVGTGFHPDLTGRENTYLNGTIMGMRKREIDSRFDEIVDFAEVEKFIDTPVKHYSSGMYTRLAFAVAAHLTPEILIVDEVLAVGDSQFQKKCLGKMENVASEGRTVLFVSHNMGAITTLCNTALYLEKGIIKSFGNTSKIVREYFATDRKHAGESNSYIYNLGDDSATLNKVDIINESRTLVNLLTVDESFGIKFYFEVNELSNNPQPNILVSTYDGQKIFQSIDNGDYTRHGKYISVVWIPANLLNNGEYIVTCALTTLSPVNIHVSVDFTIDVLDNINATTRGEYKGEMHGLIRPLLNWQKINDKKEVKCSQ